MQLLVSYQTSDPLAQAFQRQLERWSADDWDFPALIFHDQQSPVAFTSRAAIRRRRHIRRDIKAAQRLLVVVSRRTWQSEWVDWEIATAVEQDKQVLAAKLDPTNMIPLALHANQPIWIEPFDPKELAPRSGLIH